MAKRIREWPAPTEPLPTRVMDNHTHLPVHSGEIPSPGGIKLALEEQLDRAVAANVDRVITCGCALPDLQPTIDLAGRWPGVRAAIAIHPNEVALHAGHLDRSPDGYEHRREEHHVPLNAALDRVAALLDDPAVVAVGETGLDYFRTAGPGREAQAESFRAHLEMARSHGLPLQIHDREAHADTLGILRDSAWKDQEIVFHCFSGDAEMAAVLAENGWYASFAGPITYPANEDLRAALRAMPRNRVLVETDAPYLTPMPYRGCPNASYVMPFTVRAIAELWEEDLEGTCSRLLDNSHTVYGRW